MKGFRTPAAEWWLPPALPLLPQGDQPGPSAGPALPFVGPQMHLPPFPATADGPEGGPTGLGTALDVNWDGRQGDTLTRCHGAPPMAARWPFLTQRLPMASGGEWAAASQALVPLTRSVVTVGPLPKTRGPVPGAGFMQGEHRPTWPQPRAWCARCCSASGVDSGHGRHLRSVL